MLNSTLANSDKLDSSESTFTELDHVVNEIISDAIIAFISFTGILSNGLAVFILSSTSSIRKSRPYILLVNQCLMDILALLSSEICIAAKYVLKSDGMEGIVDQLLCNLLHNDFFLVVNSCASSYNLAALSAERMFSVVWPIRHRISFTPKNMKRAATAIWLFSFAAMLSHSIGTNGISPNGRCYFWVAQLGTHSTIFLITFNLVFSVFPFVTMAACYTCMYARILGSDLKVKMNIIHVLGTCVILYFVCHAPRVIHNMLSWLTRISWLSMTTFNIAIAFLVANTFVNPVVYMLQFNEYKLEFRRQMSRILGRTLTRVSPN